MKRIVVYLFIIFGLSYIVREFVYSGLRKNKSGEFDKLNTIFIKQNKYDCLIIGSSRAESHFMPSVIDSVTGLNSFNAGQGGASQDQNNAILKSYLVHSKAPKIVLLNIDLQTLNAANDTIREFFKYFPYLGNDTLYQRINKIDTRFRYFKWIPFYSLPYLNDYYLSASLRGWLGRSGKNDKTYDKGFTPEYVHADVDLDKLDYSPAAYNLSDPFLKSRQFIAICKQEHIQLIMVVTPMYYKATQALSNKDAIITELKKRADDDYVVFIDCTGYELCRDKTRFSNPRHLNINGARLFSQQFGLQLLQYSR